MLVLRIFIILLLSNSLWAIKIPICVSRLGKPNENKDDPYRLSNNSYDFVDDILRKHQDFNAASTILISGYGIGIIPLTASVITETTHTTEWGKEKNRARKLKDLLIASSDTYVTGDSTETVSRKSAGNRKNAHLKNQPLLIKLYNKLKNYKVYSPWGPLKIDELKSLLQRANRTGVLCEEMLFRRIIVEDSFDPLCFVIATGQLEDRVSQVEEILMEREQKENEIKENLTAMQTNMFKDVDSSIVDAQAVLVYKQLYTDIKEKIEAIYDFEL